jgi:uncharacterized membrane protein
MALSESRVRIALAAVAIVGLTISAYLTVVHLEGTSPVCLAGATGCGIVQASDYAELLGVPVPVIGIAGYLGVLASALLAGEPGRMLGLFAGIVGVAFSAYLTYLELWVIDAICQWCIASAVVMCMVLVLAGIRVVRWGGLPGGRAGAGEATDRQASDD